MDEQLWTRFAFDKKDLPPLGSQSKNKWQSPKQPTIIIQEETHKPSKVEYLKQCQLRYKHDIENLLESHKNTLDSGQLHYLYYDPHLKILASPEKIGIICCLINY